MNENTGFAKYRAALGDENDREFVIVTVMENGSISWSTVSEHAFNETGYGDLPEHLLEQINDAYGKLKFLDDNAT